MDVDDEVVEGLEERLVDADRDDFEYHLGDDLKDGLEDEASEDFLIESQNVCKDDNEDDNENGAEDGVEDGIEGALQASPEGDSIHDLEDTFVLSDMSAPEEGLTLQMYCEDLQKLRSHLIKEPRDSLWSSCSFDTREEYETELPFYNKGPPKLGNKEAEGLSLEDAMEARRDCDEYLREHMPKPGDKEKEPEPAAGRRQPRRSTRNK